jgi:elongation factor Ts
MAVDAKSVKELRRISGAGMMDCKKALTEADGNIDEAMKLLREKGIKVASKRADRQASDGLIYAYIHGPGKLGVLVEVNCETDFVARTDEFTNFCKLTAMQIAASDPLYVSREDVPEEVLAEEKDILKKQLDDSGKPDNIIEKIVIGRLDKFYSEICLLDQEWIHDSSAGTVNDVLLALIARTGEKTVINRFARFSIGS